MEDPFCDQSKAYPADSTTRGAQAVTLYEQFREAILAVEETLADDEKLLVSWCDAAGESVEVDHLGYYGQTLLVLRGRNGEGLEFSVLVPALSLHLALKKIKKLPGDENTAFNFMGHSVLPAQPSESSA